MVIASVKMWWVCETKDMCEHYSLALQNIVLSELNRKGGAYAQLTKCINIVEAGIWWSYIWHLKQFNPFLDFFG